MLGIDFDPWIILFSYLALLVTIIGCELCLSYVTKYYAQDCIEPNDLVIDGKITFNPLKYFDVFGTVVFPLAMIIFQAPLLFGWSKSLWLNMQKVVDRYGLNLAILLASSGVFFHFFIAFLSSFILSAKFLPQMAILWENLILFNVFFVVIKLCPIFPYDGLKILSYIGLKLGSDLLMRFYWMLIPYGMFVLILVILTPLRELILIPAVTILKFLL
ncbi:hypothetical protein [Helicobacter pametensis]|uniref:hypothetical protein n=1 Tax=Helicobacter pametensis TaxID=95149 RepID=UPI0004BCBE5C|nr:hypothetical protein [Helicobacter pametensis]